MVSKDLAGRSREAAPSPLHVQGPGSHGGRAARLGSAARHCKAACWVSFQMLLMGTL